MFMLIDACPAAAAVSENRTLDGSPLVTVSTVAGAGENVTTASSSRFWPTVTFCGCMLGGLMLTVTWFLPPAGVEYPAGVPAVMVGSGAPARTAWNVAVALGSPPLMVTWAVDTVPLLVSELDSGT